MSRGDNMELKKVTDCVWFYPFEKERDRPILGYIKGDHFSVAVDAEHWVELVSLNPVEVKGCMGCNACRYGKPCVQKDGFSELVPKIKAADLIVFASPLLFWTISAKLKAFIERFYCIAEIGRAHV